MSPVLGKFPCGNTIASYTRPANSGREELDPYFALCQQK